MRGSTGGVIGLPLRLGLRRVNPWAFKWANRSAVSLTQVASLAKRGYLYAFLAAVSGGAIPTLSKLALAEYGPVPVSGFGFLLSGMMLLPMSIRQVPNSKSLKYVAVFGVLGAAAGPLVYQFGLNSTTAVNTSLLSNGEALFTALIAFAAFGERLRKRQLAVGSIIVAGIVVVSTNLDLGGVHLFEGLAGNLMILTSMFFWSVENNLIVSATRRFGPLLVTKYRNLIGGGLVSTIAVTLGLEGGFSVLGFTYIVMLAVALASASYFAIAALGGIGAIRAILVYSASTVFGAAFALVFLGEEITSVQIVGGFLILVGVYLLARSERTPGNPPGTKEEFR
jgi:drug/metabolite transporter (DMT)-like permease